MSHFDVAIIGGGPGGYVAAIKAAQSGKSVVLAEKDALGGVCLNRGCIPTKTIIKSISVLNTVRECVKFGVRGIEPHLAEIDLQLLHDRQKRVVKQLTGGVGSLLKANRVTVKKGLASFRDPRSIVVNDEVVSADHFIIATGSKPARLPVSISDHSPVITSDEALELQELPKNIVIIGGGIVGIEFAYIFSQLGVKVTVIELLEHILPTVDEEIAEAVAEQLRCTGVELLTGVKVKGIDGGRISCQSDTGEKVIETELILMAVGRLPNTEGLNLSSLNMRMNKAAIAVDDRMQTSVLGIYAIGDVNGHSMLAHTASMEGLVAVDNILGKERKIDYRRIPSCIYIHPEVASVGLTEAQARAEFKDIKVGRFPIAANGKSVVEGELRGKIKVIIEPRYGEILGVHIHCSHATDMIAEAVVAMQAELTVEEMLASVHPHPSISEIVPEAFHAALGRAIHS